MCVKIISLGFVMDLNCYLRDSWCQMDFIIVVFPIVDMSLTSYNISFIKVIRMLRILRSLRFISNNQNLKILVNCLLESLSGLSNVFLVIILIWYIFNI